MDKIKRILKSTSLGVSFAIFGAIFIFIAIVLISSTTLICQKMSNDIFAKYPNDKEYFLATKEGEILEISDAVVSVFPNEDMLPDNDREKVLLLHNISIYCIPVYSFLCLLAASFLFYQLKIKKPYLLLQKAHKYISEDNLDFTVQYDYNDEMGKLVSSFEKMRLTLYENNQNMWQQMREREQINDAFAHDLRTPLTVLKGYLEMLKEEQINSEISDITSIMEKQVLRLERYVESMSNLQKLDDIIPTIQTVSSTEISSEINQSASVLCKQANKILVFHNNLSKKEIFVDLDLVHTAVSNLISNAIRFSNSNIEIDIYEEGVCLYVSVSDDGGGFTNEGLQKATSPYYTGEMNRSIHFGLGLYTSKVLSIIHGGNIKTQNTDHGAKVTIHFKASR